MKRPTYVQALLWVALEDDPTELDEEQIRSTLTVGLVADLFGVTTEQVSKSVVLIRRSNPS